MADTTKGTASLNECALLAGNGTWDEWLSLFINRNDVAEEYARMMRLHGLKWGGYAYVNAAILRRWSPSGLAYIKTRAWKIATGNL